MESKKTGVRVDGKRNDIGRKTLKKEIQIVQPKNRGGAGCVFVGGGVIYVNLANIRLLCWKGERARSRECDA